MKFQNFLQRRVFSVFMMVGVSLGLQAQDGVQSPEKLRLVRELMTIQGHSKLGDDGVKTMIEEEKKFRPKVSAQAWKSFEAGIKTLDLQYQTKLEKFYMESYSEQTLRDLVTFFKSPSGKDFLVSSQKMMGAVALLMQEMQVAFDELIEEKLGTLESSDQAKEGK